MSLAPVLLAAVAAAVVIGVPAPSPLERLGADRAEDLHPWRWWPLALPLLVLELGLAGTAVVTLVGAVARRSWLRRLAEQAREAERASAGEAMSVLAAELRAGRPPADAFEAAAGLAVGPLAVALATAASGQRWGVDASATLAQSAPTSAVPGVLRGLAACWQVCSTSGSSLAAAVDQLAASLRAERAQRLAVDAELAGPRATAGLLAMLPLLGLSLAAGLGAGPVHVLLHTPLGVGCLVAGVGLDLLGLWWTDRLVASAGRSR